MEEVCIIYYVVQWQNSTYHSGSLRWAGWAVGGLEYKEIETTIGVIRLCGIQAQKVLFLLLLLLPLRCRRAESNIQEEEEYIAFFYIYIIYYIHIYRIGRNETDEKERDAREVFFDLALIWPNFLHYTRTITRPLLLLCI